MRKFIFLLIIIILYPTKSHAQKEYNNWYFGDFFGLNFNTNPPEVLTNSYISFDWEYSSLTMSDTAGGLLYYSDGSMVVDKTHNIMQNGMGLTGYVGSAVTLKAGNFYMIVTYNHLGRLRYNLIDMSKNGGNGAVVSKNQQITSDKLDKYITLAKHENGEDFWIITKEFHDTVYRSYLVHDTTINPPVISKVGSINVVLNGNLVGDCFMRVAPSGQILVVSTLAGTEIYDFNPSNGEISNPINMNYRETYSSHFDSTIDVLPVYRFGFSSNSKYMYYQDTQGIARVNITLPDKASIIASREICTSSPLAPNGQRLYAWYFELGPNNSLYFNCSPYNYVGVIENPDDPVSQLIYDSTKYQIDTVALNIYKRYTLPQIYKLNIPAANFNFDNTCHGDTTRLIAWAHRAYDSIYWDFGDTASSLANYDYDSIGEHVYTNTGTYTAMMVAYKGTFTDTAYREIIIYTKPQFSLGADTAVCQGESVDFDFTALAPDDMIWSDGTREHSISFKDSGLHWGVIIENNCIAIDSIYIVHHPIHNFSLPQDTFSCVGDSLIFNIGSGADEYHWSSNDNDSILKLQSGGKFDVFARIGDCYTYDTVNVEFRDKPAFSLGNDTTICFGETVNFRVSGFDTSYNFLWHNFTRDSSLKVGLPKTVTLKLSKNGCYHSDTAIVNVDWPFVTSIPDTFTCAGDTLSLAVDTGADTYYWSSGSDTIFERYSTQGTYTLTVTKGVCERIDTFSVEIKPKPMFNLGMDTLICNTDSIAIGGTNGVKYLWNTGDTTQNIIIKPVGTYILTQYTNYCDYSDTINIAVQQQPSINIGNDTVVCIGQKVIIGATIPNGIQYTWNNRGDATPKITTDSQSIYSVIAYDGVCRAYDTMFVGVYTPQSIELGQDSTLCAGTATLLDAAINRGEYLWNDGVQTPTRLITQSGNYSVLVTDSVCQYSDAITITFNPVPDLDLGSDTFLCQDEVHQVFVNPQWESVLWQDGNSEYSRIFTTEGKYLVIADYLNCQATDSITINYYPPLPTLDLGADQDVCDPLFYPLQANYNGYYPLIWNTGDKGNYIEVTKTGDYIVSTAPHRCGQVSDTVHITFLKELCDLHVPTAFSPNGDGRNDTFFPIGYQAEVENMRIYNRWGELLFDGVTPWDGTYKGESVPAGNYLYIITYKKEHRGGKKRVFTKGTVLVIR